MSTVTAPEPVAMPAAVSASSPSAHSSAITADPFQAAFTILLPEEGGFGDDERDPGNWTGGHVGVGACQGTKYGCASSSYAGDCAKLPTNIRANMPATVRDLTVAQAGSLYRVAYWQATRCDELPSPVNLVVFDCAVNNGVGRSIEFLQKAVGAVPDGGFGPATMAAVRATVAAHGAQALAAVIVDERDAFYRGLAQFPIYGKGWLNRDAGLRVHLATFPNGVL